MIATADSAAAPPPTVTAGGLLVFSDDWGRHPSSCQHLIGRLLARHKVAWVNTIATRAPSLNLDTLRRGWEKLRHWSRPADPAAPLPQNLRVCNPRMWPWQRTRFDRWLNRRLLARQLAPVAQALPAPAVAVTTLPVVADLMGRLPVPRWVYYCVDDFNEWPGVDGSAMRRLEEIVVARADAVIAVSETLCDKMARLGRNAHLLTHGVNPDWWCAPDPGESVPGLAGLERPLVVFWGLLDRRMDVSWVRQLAASLTAGTIVLAGPELDPDPALFALPRVVKLGQVPFACLPGLAAAASVLVMPYDDLPATRAMQPLKLKEYLATGRPVVLRDLPATRDWADCADVVATAEDFVAAVRVRLDTGLPKAQRAARHRLAGESWAAKAADFERWVFGTGEGTP